MQNNKPLLELIEESEDQPSSSWDLKMTRHYDKRLMRTWEKHDPIVAPP